MSIYHFRENNPSQAEQRLAASHRFAEQINKSLEPHQKFKFDQKAKEADRAQKQAFADQIMNDPSLAGLDIQTRRLLANEAAGLTSAQSTKSLINAMRDREANESFNEALRGDGGQAGAAPTTSSGESLGPMEEEESQTPPQKPKRNYDAELEKWQKILRNPRAENQKFAQAKIDEIHRAQEREHQEAKTNLQEKQFGHTHTAKYAESVAEDAEQARNILHANKGLRTAIKNGATGLNARNAMYKYLTSVKSPLAGLFQTKDTQAVVNSQKALSGGFKKLFGSKPTEREFFWYENILPDLLKSGEVNEGIADYYDDIAKVMLRSEQLMDDIVKKNGGYRPIDIDRRVREMMQPELEKLIERGENLSGYVMMKDPNGVTRQIPKNRVEAAKKAGGVEIQ
jgi:hypothetical protein